ncbi:hypothetical protein D3C80_1774950 [compost metagenome]
MIFVGGFFIDQIPLRRIGDIGALAIKLLVAAGAVVHIGLQRIPVHRHVGGVAGGDGGIGDVVIHLAGGLDVVAQFYQRAVDQLGLKTFFRECALQRFNRDAFAGKFGGERLCA